MRLHCEFSTPVARTDLDDYIRHLEISVGCYDEDGLNEYVVGKLAVDQIMWMNALVDGVSLFEICDSDSQGLHEVHTILTKGKQEFRPDLKIKEVTSHVMFVYGPTTIVPTGTCSLQFEGLSFFTRAPQNRRGFTAQ